MLPWTEQTVPDHPLLPWLGWLRFRLGRPLCTWCRAVLAMQALRPSFALASQPTKTGRVSQPSLTRKSSSWCTRRSALLQLSYFLPPSARTRTHGAILLTHVPGPSTAAACGADRATRTARTAARIAGRAGTPPDAGEYHKYPVRTLSTPQQTVALRPRQ